MSALFKYTGEQHSNIRRDLHPDCCVDAVCAYCGASEENGQACHGELEGLALELFEEASCSARNANVNSIGQSTNRQMHDRHARAFDAAARALAAQAIEARQGPDPQGLDAKHESAVRQDAPQSYHGGKDESR